MKNTCLVIIMFLFCNSSSAIDLAGVWQGDPEKSLGWARENLKISIEDDEFKGLGDLYFNFFSKEKYCRVLTSIDLDKNVIRTEVDWLQDYEILESNEDAVLLKITDEDLVFHVMFIFESENSFYFVQLRKDSEDRIGVREFYSKLPHNKSINMDALSCANY